MEKNSFVVEATFKLNPVVHGEVGYFYFLFFLFLFVYYNKTGNLFLCLHQLAYDIYWYSFLCYNHSFTFLY